MAYFTQTHETPISIRFSIAATSLAEDIKKYRLYRKTVSELQKLPTATLTDLGLSRSGINASAKEAVYGC